MHEAVVCCGLIIRAWPAGVPVWHRSSLGESGHFVWLGWVRFPEVPLSVGVLAGFFLSLLSLLRNRRRFILLWVGVGVIRYGVPYRGSKSRVAEWVVECLPTSHTLVDLFAGGCAVSHAALLSGKWGRVVANDLTDVPGVFLRAARGEFRGYDVVPTRVEFEALKSEDPLVALLYSFGNNGRDYLWGPKYEGVKVAASRMLSAGSLRERRLWYRRFLRELAVYLDGRDVGELKRPNGVAELEGLERLEGLQRLERLQGLERLERLQGLEGLERLEVSKLDYRDVTIPDGATVYADPPYRGTSCVGVDAGGFDFDAFDQWLASTPFPVFVSEFTAPSGCVEIASRERRSSMSANGKNSRAVERLFVQERFVESIEVNGELEFV